MGGVQQRGFTIVELLIVIVVIAILAAITIVSYTGIQARALAASYDLTAQSIVKKAELVYQQTGKYPTSTNLFPTNGSDPAALPNNIRVAYTQVGTNSMFNRVSSVTTDPTNNDVGSGRASAIYKNSVTGVMTFIARECPFDATNTPSQSAGTGFRLFYVDPLAPDVLDQKTITVGTGCT